MLQLVGQDIGLNTDGFGVEDTAFCNGASGAGRGGDGEEASMGQI